MYIIHKNHNIKRDLEHLINLIYKDNLTYIDDYDQYDNTGLLFVTEYNKEKNKIISKLYKEAIEINSSEIILDDINIGIKNKRRILNTGLKHSIIEIWNLKDKLPWGILTGIRPMKIVHNLLDENFNYIEIKEILKEGYLLNKEKADLLLDISKTQRNILKKNKGKISLYINIPFCPSRCSYCSFTSIINPDENSVKEYLKTLIYELKETLKTIKKSQLGSIYIGGGTPSYLEAEELVNIIEIIKESGYKINELTVEAGRADTLDRDYFKKLKAAGVNRLSINPQTMNDNTLTKVNRNHNSKDIIEKYNMAKEIGFDWINMDLIIGLEDENINDIKNTLNEISKLNPDNLTIHSLAIKTNSNLELEDLPDDKKVSSMMDEVIKFAKLEGYKPYYIYRQKNISGNLENIGFYKENICEYNISMMEERETILAVGLGAVSKIYQKDGRIKRLANHKGLGHYINGVEQLLDAKR